MPNWCFNHVYMRNIGNMDIYTEQKDSSPELDFNKIIPMPEELGKERPYADVAIDEAMICLLTRLIRERIFYLEDHDLWLSSIAKRLPEIKEKHEKDVAQVIEFAKGEAMKEYFPSGLTRDELLQNGFTYLSYIAKYGYSGWYEWCTNVWGTKWNAWDTCIIDNDNVDFVTAWGSPEGIFKELSKRNPYDPIHVQWEEEGGYAGQDEYLDGDCVESKTFTIDGQGMDYGEWAEKVRNRKLFHKIKLLGVKGEKDGQET